MKRMIIIMCLLLTLRAAAAEDLLSPADAWTTWSARAELAPRFSAEAADAPEGRRVLVVSATGKAEACGCWRRALPKLAKGRRYRIEAAFQAPGVREPWRSAWAIVTQGDKEYAELNFTAERDGWHRMALELAPERVEAALDLRLYLAWSPEGSVRWSAVMLTDITGEPIKRRVARLAAVAGRPKAPRSAAECLDFYCARLDEVGKRGADLALLPEVINTDGIAGADKMALAEPIPGPSSNRLAEKARQYKMYVAASLIERDGTKIFNTGVLLDRAGRVVGKYRKTHPTIGECLMGQITPGDDYPVFETDFGRVGYLICFDNHYPEVARILALKGADVILHSNMADSRESGALWEPYIRTRALDNGVYLVAAVNAKGTCIVNPRGEIVAAAPQKPGAIALAECEMGMSLRNYSGREIGKRYFLLRRFDTFEPLTRHYFDLK